MRERKRANTNSKMYINWQTALSKWIWRTVAHMQRCELLRVTMLQRLVNTSNWISCTAPASTFYSWYEMSACKKTKAMNGKSGAQTHAGRWKWTKYPNGAKSDLLQIFNLATRLFVSSFDGDGIYRGMPIAHQQHVIYTHLYSVMNAREEKKSEFIWQNRQENSLPTCCRKFPFASQSASASSTSIQRIPIEREYARRFPFVF